MARVVSAIVSLYNAERFLRGRLDDLMAQTLYAQGRLEIICVNAGSKQHEGRILRDTLERGVPLKIISTGVRVGIYEAWNRGIRLATGDYITNANADDRLAHDALEKLAIVLDASGADIAYADSFVTDTVNGTWGKYHPSLAPPYTSGTLDWGDFDPDKLRRFCCIGQAPMWRKDLHQRLGTFDESFLLAGDYEFWLRAAARGARFEHVAERLGLFYFSDNATTVNQAQSDYEARRAQLRWRSA